MKQDKEKAAQNATWLVIGLMLICCLAPILLTGVMGAWFSSLTGKEIIPSLFFGLTLVFIGFGYRKLYLPGNCCEDDQASETCDVKQKQRLIFWIVSTLVLTLWVFLW